MPLFPWRAPEYHLAVAEARSSLRLEDAVRLLGAAGVEGPSSWLLETEDLLPGAGEALDVACGSGRHALLMAAAGLRVRAVDRDAARLRELTRTAARLNLALTTGEVDLEAEAVDLGSSRFDLAVVVHFLHRPLFPALRRALRPGGVLVYETFTVAQAARGHPRNPRFLLTPGELPRLVAPLEVLRQREGEYGGRMVASVAARKAADPAGSPRSPSR